MIGTTCLALKGDWREVILCCCSGLMDMLRNVSTTYNIVVCLSICDGGRNTTVQLGSVKPHPACQKRRNCVNMLFWVECYGWTWDILICPQWTCWKHRWYPWPQTITLWWNVCLFVWYSKRLGPPCKVHWREKPFFSCYASWSGFTSQIVPMTCLSVRT